MSSAKTNNLKSRAKQISWFELLLKKYYKCASKFVTDSRALDFDNTLKCSTIDWIFIFSLNGNKSKVN